MLVIISVQPRGANLEASAYLSDKMIKRCATEAIRPIIAIIIHSFKVGLTQTEGINTLIIASPTTPVNKSVRSELSEVLSFRVITKQNPQQIPQANAAKVAKLTSIKPGLITIKVPKNPTRTADHLLMPTFSPKKNGDKAVQVIGATNASVKALGSEITDIEQKKHKVEKARIIPLTS